MVKTRVQLEPEKFAGNGFLDNAKTLVAEEGVGVLLGGLGSTALGYSLHGSLKYAGFEWLKYAVVHHGGGRGRGIANRVIRGGPSVGGVDDCGYDGGVRSDPGAVPSGKERRKGGGGLNPSVC